MQMCSVSAPDIAASDFRAELSETTAIYVLKFSLQSGSTRFVGAFPTLLRQNSRSPQQNSPYWYLVSITAWYSQRANSLLPHAHFEQRPDLRRGMGQPIEAFTGSMIPQGRLAAAFVDTRAKPRRRANGYVGRRAL